MVAASEQIRTLSQALELHPLLPLAWRAAEGSAQLLLHERPQQLTVGAKSSPTDAVTEMDTRSERQLVDVLLGARPQDAILGEEGGERTGTSGVRWVVDPLDGTVNYLYRLPMWGVSVAAEEHGVVQVGVVLTPTFAEGYLAVQGAGAWHVADGVARRLVLDDVDDLGMALVTTGFGYRRQQRVQQAAVVRALLPQVRDLRRTGSAVVDYCWLARGRFDAFFEAGLHPWDRAAGALIAEQAGAMVRTLQNPGGLDVHVAAKPGIADPLCAALIAAGATAAVDDVGRSAEST